MTPARVAAAVDRVRHSFAAKLLLALIASVGLLLLATVVSIRVQTHRRALQRRRRRGAHAAAVVLGQNLQGEPRGSRHVEVGAGRELGQFADTHQARFPDGTVDFGQHVCWQASFTHRDPSISMR